MVASVDLGCLQYKISMFRSLTCSMIRIVQRVYDGIVLELESFALFILLQGFL